MKTLAMILLSSLFVIKAGAATNPYANEFNAIQAQDKAECMGFAYPSCDDQGKLIQNAITRANASNRGLFIIVGFDVCEACGDLERMLQDEDTRSELNALAQNYVIVHIDMSMQSAYKKVARRYDLQTKVAPTVFVAHPKGANDIVVDGKFYPTQLDKNNDRLYPSTISLLNKANQISTSRFAK